MKHKIGTTGELREFLVNMMVGVKDGDIDIARAQQIGKLAAQVTESFYAELKTAQVQTSLGKTAVELGSLQIAGASPDAPRT